MSAGLDEMVCSRDAIGAVIRGRLIDQHMIAFGGRGAGVEFLSPDPMTLIDRLPLTDPTAMSDLYQISLDDVLDYLAALGEWLNIDTNAHVQHACRAARATSSFTPPLIESAYRALPAMFDRRRVREMIDQNIGSGYLEDWQTVALLDGRQLSVRAFGARAVHIIAGNSPMTAAITIIRNAVTRSDAIIKSPSNDPYTALAIVRSMMEMAPEHPLTRHVSVAYWRGGDERVERALYQPAAIEKLIAWGGLASVRHVTKYIQPGLELVTLDPKRSISLIGAAAFADDRSRRDAAIRLATDIGAYNQEGCVSARVVYVQTGTHAAGLAALNAFGRCVYDAMMALPQRLSTPPKSTSHELRSYVAAAALNDDWYHVIGGDEDEGAIIVSQTPARVDFAPLLANRVANLVPFSAIEDVFVEVDAYTQTVGIYPDDLKALLRDRLPLYGVQRMTSLGYATVPTFAAPQDAIEPLRRMCRWIVDETCDPSAIEPPWRNEISGIDT